MAEPTAPGGVPRLTARFLAAVALATETHGEHSRLGTGIPYLAHLLVVSGLVLCLAQSSRSQGRPMRASRVAAVRGRGSHPRVLRDALGVERAA